MAAALSTHSLTTCVASHDRYFDAFERYFALFSSADLQTAACGLRAAI
jgi:hypothetical protein